MEMDLVHDRATDIPEEEKEDRISNLPDEIIHRILSFIDMKYAIQTSSLSKKWKYVWTSMPYLKLDTHMFRTMPHFIKFMKHALSHRNHRTEISAVELKFRGFNQLVAKSILKYAYSHNLKQLTIICSTLSMKTYELPQSLFSSHTVKHLNLTVAYGYRMYAPKSAWDFPVLETLNLSNMPFGDYVVKSLDLFSKCVNLKDLKLDNCDMWGMDVFNVYVPQLSNLTITNIFRFPKVFNMVAPQLQTLTTMVCDCNSSFLQLSTEGFDSLEKVNLSMRPFVGEKDRYAPGLLDLFQKLCGAKFLILDEGIVEVLSECLDQPCPFNNLKYLKIDKQKNPTATLPAEVRNYFLEGSPNVTFIMDLPQLSHEPSSFNKMKCLNQTDCIPKMSTEVKNQLLESSPSATSDTDSPQVPRKRSRQEADKDTMAKKVAKLEEEKQTMAEEKRMLETKIAMQDGVIAEQKAMKLQQEKLMSQMINCKMAELQVQVAGGDPGYELVCLIKSIMDLMPESLRVSMDAQLSCLYEEMKSLFFTRIDASQWAKIEMELGITERTRSNNNVECRSDVPAALPLAPSSSSADVDNDTTANTLEEENQQTETVDEEKRMLEAKVCMQDEVIVEQKAKLEAMKVQHEKRMLEEKMQVQDKIITRQKAMLELLHENGMLEEKMQMRDEMIAEQKALLETMKLQNEKRMFEAKIQRQDKTVSQQKAMLEAMKLQNEKIETELVNIDSC